MIAARFQRETEFGLQALPAHFNSLHRFLVQIYFQAKAGDPQWIDAYVIVLDNVTSPRIVQISQALAAILFDQKYEMPRQHKHTTISVPQNILDRYVGQYQLAPSFIITVTRAGDQLNAQPPASRACRFTPNPKRSSSTKSLTHR